MYREYLERLGRTLALDPTTGAPPPLALAPRTGALQVAIEAPDINTLDFLALHGCALQVNIARKNSSLGRLARPSQALLLELEFLRLAPACIEELEREGRNELAAELATAQALKRDQLPARIFNATLGADEYRAFWRTSRPPGEFPSVPNAVTLKALHAIDSATARWLAGDYAVDGFEFELLLSEVAGGSGGELLLELNRLTHWLGAADRLLQARSKRGPLCGPNLRREAADILPNVVEKYFVAQIQPGAAALNRSYHELLPPIRNLEERLASTAPAAFSQWRGERDSVLSEGTEASRRHVAQIQSLLEPCRAAPGL